MKSWGTYKNYLFQSNQLCKGVEGQIAIVCAFFTLAFALRDSWFYCQVPFKAGSISIAVVASIWMMERLFDFKALPF